jgi:hypothetical protein
LAVSITNGKRGSLGRILQHLPDRISIHVGKQDVGEDDIGTVLSGHFKPRKSVPGYENAESRFAQAIAKQIRHSGFVFNNKDRVLHAALPIDQEVLNLAKTVPEESLSGELHLYRQ